MLKRVLALALVLTMLGTAAQSSRRPIDNDRYASSVRSAIRERSQDRGRSLDRQPIRSRDNYSYRSGAMGSAVQSEIRREARRRYYRNRMIYRPYGVWYPGFGYYRDDSSAFKWLAFTAITLKVLDNLNEAAQRRHEDAQIRATTARVGDPVAWSEGNSRGSVTATREFESSGQQCREFQQKVEIGGKTEEAYGTACLQPDGAWKIVQ